MGKWPRKCWHSGIRFVMLRKRLLSSSREFPMKATASFIRRELSDVQPWLETCGEIRCLIEEKDQAAGEVHHLKITDAKLHYHAKTDEFYYILGGQGHMQLD